MSTLFFSFIGDDELQKNEALDHALETWLGGDARDEMARETFFGDDIRLEAVTEAYNTSSLFAAKKALIIRNFEKANAASQKFLERLFRDENPCVSVFIQAEKWEARSPMRKLFQSKGKIAEFKLPYPNQIPQWLAGRSQVKYGRKLRNSDAVLLQELVGNDLSELDRELQKLDTFLPKGRDISGEDIEELIGSHRTIDIFEFQKNMGLREKGKLLGCLRSLEEAGEPSFQIVLRLYQHFLVLLKIRIMDEAGMGIPSIAEVLKLNPHFHFKRLQYMEQARSRPSTLWKKILIRLAKMEWEMKQGKYPHRFELEMALAGIV